MLNKKVTHRFVRCSWMPVCLCVSFVCEQVGQGEKGECVMKTERETVSDFSSSSVLSPRSPAVVNSQLDT